MLDFINPFDTSENPSHGKMLLETQKLKAKLIQQIISNKLDASIDVKTLMRVVESIDSTALNALKQESIVSEDEVSKTAAAVISKILADIGMPEPIEGNFIRESDPTKLPDLTITDGELMEGVETLNVDDFFQEGDEV